MILLTINAGVMMVFCGTMTVLTKSSENSPELKFDISYEIRANSSTELEKELYKNFFYSNFLRDIKKEYNFFSVRHIPVIEQNESEEF